MPIFSMPLSWERLNSRDLLRFWRQSLLEDAIFDIIRIGPKAGLPGILSGSGDEYMV